MKLRTPALAFVASAIAVLLATAAGVSQTASPALVLGAKIPLGEVRGRIDHMAADLRRKRLFVAELGNDSVGIVDLEGHALVHRITGLHEPQGVGYVAAGDTLYVANAGDGAVRLFNADSFAPTGQIALGSDADNIRVDAERKQVFVGYGGGGLAVIDPVSQRKIADIPLAAHPESFQLAADGSRIFVNLPDARAIAVVDRPAGRQTAKWSTDGAAGNFPMAVTPDGERVLVVFRSPAKLAVFAAKDGKRIASVDTCGDADDVFVDAKRQRIYVSCGEGFIDVLGATEGYPRLGRVSTLAGARTALFVPELDLLALAVRARSGEPAAIWLYRPTP
jgi:DNA-binding beta-propeller fold protein YncE